ncbi:hypothetical protein [Neotabrizicola sp. VNH66]|uniref:hypothetical protein n=1 Tax=Neotabrizicola sp. VNH66 TaxID=3400918 RepID=UPI003C0BFCCE
MGDGAEDHTSPQPPERLSPEALSPERPATKPRRRFFASRAEARKARAARLRPRIPLRLVLVLILLVLGLGFATMVLTGRTLSLPVWAVAQIETRLNDTLAPRHLAPGVALSLGGVDIAVERDLTPRLVLRDLRLNQPGGRSIVTLPEVRVTLDPGALITGETRVSGLRLTGARLSVTRDADGRIALDFAGMSGAPALQSPAEVLDAVDRMFGTPALSKLHLIEAEALALTLEDRRAGRSWELGDGRLVIENREGSVAGELGVTLLDGATPAQARLTIETNKADSSARLTVTVDQIAAADLAAQAAPLTFLNLLDAPISGRLSGALEADGSIGPLEAQLSVAAGSLRVSETALPVPFEPGEIALSYDPQRQRVTMNRLRVESASLRLKASGTADLFDAGGAPVSPGELPAAAVVQLAVSEMMVDPEGLFEAPVRFSSGAASLRLSLRPFRAEIGEVTLREGDETLRLTGDLGVASEGGWRGALDVALNRIGSDRLIRLWPVSVVPKTRDWLASNLGQGEFTDLAAALRFVQGERPNFALNYNFSGAEVRVIRALPPVRDGRGRATIEDNAYTVVLEGGEVTAPGLEADPVAVAGSVFRVPDITVMPAMAEVRLISDSSLRALLQLLDQEPFRFISKAGRSPDLGEGRAVMAADLRFPLKAGLQPADVDYDVAGRVLDFHSSTLVEGREITGEDLAVKVTPAGLTVSGAGAIEGVPVVARYDQPFGKDTGGKASLRGTATLSDEGLRKLGISLPQGWLSGRTEAEVVLSLARGQPAVLDLTSTLAGAGLAVPPLSWSKARGTGGRLTLSAVLGARPEITALSLAAPGLEVEGRLTTKAGGGLDRMSLSQLRAGRWLDATAEITGQGPNAVSVRLTGGSADLRERPSGGSGGDGGASAPIEVNLDRLTVSSGIALTGFSGDFISRGGGLDGHFVAAVNGTGRIEGAAMPYRGGTAVRITAKDAGAVMAAAGIFTKGRGGTLDMTLQPSGAEGNYAGFASFTGMSVQNAPALAALLSAASVVGLLEQLNGQGIHFAEGDTEFLIRPEGVQILRGAAVGASMGISFEGFYRAATGRLDIQGTVSPLYLLNGIGAIFGRRGEGLFGFTYRLTGKADNPQVSVNPLSILTPGMFREIFRRPAPKLESGG